MEQAVRIKQSDLTHSLGKTDLSWGYNKFSYTK